jgi:DNA-binding response OmpR family regulator
MQIGVESSRSVENKRIFVVGSNEIDRAVLQFMLQDENETHELPTLDAAFAKAKEWKPELILLGLEIVKASGADVLHSIASVLPGTRILIVTEAADDPLALACLNSGAHGLLAKPFRVETVRAKVDLLLGRSIGDFLPATLLGSSARQV